MKFPCFVFFNILYSVLIICVEIVVPIVSISDVQKSELCKVLMSGDSGVWATAIVEFLLKQLAVINDGCIYTSEDVIDWSFQFLCFIIEFHCFFFWGAILTFVLIFFVMCFMFGWSYDYFHSCALFEHEQGNLQYVDQ